MLHEKFERNRSSQTLLKLISKCSAISSGYCSSSVQYPDIDWLLLLLFSFTATYNTHVSISINIFFSITFFLIYICITCIQMTSIVQAVNGEEIVCFFTRQSIFSNFFSCDFYDKQLNMTFNCSEQRYMWASSLNKIETIWWSSLNLGFSKRNTLTMKNRPSKLCSRQFPAHRKK